MTEDWTPQDSKFLKRFLESDTGKKLIAKVKAAEPDMDSDTLEGRALQAAAFSQWRKDVKLVKLWAETTTDKEVKSPFIDLEPLDVKEETTPKKKK